MQAFLEVFLTKYELCLYLFLPEIPINRVSSRPLYPQADEDQSHRQRNAVDTCVNRCGCPIRALAAKLTRVQKCNSQGEASTNGRHKPVHPGVVSNGEGER